MQLVERHEWNDMIYGKGRFEGVKRTIEMTNAEVYKYLRLGVSIQSASTLKWLGHMTPEELTESADAAALLPDHLARTGISYPMRFIDLCESEGVSAIVCQTAIRRGLSERHLDGPLSLNELLFVFTNLVKKNIAPASGGDTQPNLANFVCDGTIPFDLVKEGDISTPAAIIIAKELFLRDPESELTQKLRSDAKLFRSFAQVISGGRSTAQGVESLRKVIEGYGYQVLDLVNPSLCLHKIKRGDEHVPLGYEGALYAQQLVGRAEKSWYADQLSYSSPKKSLTFSPRDGGWTDNVQVTYAEIDDLRVAGIDPAVAYENVVNGRMAVSTLIDAKRDGVETALMSGAL
jgi:hypothetical protein